MSSQGASVHASAVKVGSRAVLIRGPSGAGKSRLAFALILAGRGGVIEPAVLVGDDRIRLVRNGPAIEASPAEELAGLIEIRGLGIRRCDFVAHAAVGLVVDLSADDAARLPAAEACLTEISGVQIPRIPVGRDFDPFPMVVAALVTTEGSSCVNPLGNCVKGIANHMRSTIATE